MGLAQPGLEEMAQQYAAGGLVAFANGGLASMVPMGYGGENDVPIFNYDGSEGYGQEQDVRGYAGGSDVKLHEYPWHPLGEGIDPSYIDEDTYRKIYEDLPTVGEGDNPPAEHSAYDTAGMSNDQPWPINPSAIQHPGFDKLRSYFSEGVDFAKSLPEETFKLNQYLGQKIANAAGDVGERWKGRAKVYGEYVDRAKNDPSLLEKLSQAFSGDSGDKTKPAESGAGSSKEKVVESKPAEGPGISTLRPEHYRPSGMPVPGAYTGYANSEEVAEQPTVVITDDIKDPEVHPAVMAPETGRIVNSRTSTEQQIAALEKLYAVDTTEAMKIKADWEKANARAGNLGIMSALAGAVGLGLGTYGPQSHRIGAGLVGLASGLASNEQQAAARQEKLDNLKMKIAEMEQSPHKKAVETIATERAKAAAREEKLRDDIQLEIAKGKVRKGVDAAKAAGKSDTAGLKEIEIRNKVISDIVSQIHAPKESPEFKAQFDKLLAQYIADNPKAAEIMRGVGYSGATPTASPTRSIGSFIGGQFTRTG